MRAPRCSGDCMKVTEIAGTIGRERSFERRFLIIDSLATYSSSSEEDALKDARTIAELNGYAILIDRLSGRVVRVEREA